MPVTGHTTTQGGEVVCLHGLNNLFPCSKIFNSKRGLRASRPIFNFLQRIIRSKNWFIKLRIFYRCLFLVRNSGPSCSRLRCLITAANLSAKIPDCISLQVFRTTKHICISSPVIAHLFLWDHSHIPTSTQTLFLWSWFVSSRAGCW